MGFIEGLVSFLSQQWLANLATIVLVLITGVYVWLTNKMVDEMQNSRTETILPHLKIQPARAGFGDSFDVRITNIGVGPAKNIRGIVSLKNGPKQEIFYPYLHPKESIYLHKLLANQGIPTMQNAVGFEKVILQVEMQDILLTNIKQVDEFDFKDREKIKNDHFDYDKMERAASQIESHLSTMAHTLSEIKNELGRRH